MRGRTAVIRRAAIGLGLVVICILLGCSRRQKSIDPHSILNENSEESLRGRFAQLSADTKFERIGTSNSIWLVAASYPYRSLNRFDVFVFEHPHGGVPGYDYGYYLREFVLVSHSQSMNVNATLDGDMIRIWHDGALLTSLASLDFKTNRSQAEGATVSRP
jgi:hypothetical protein